MIGKAIKSMLELLYAHSCIVCGEKVEDDSSCICLSCNYFLPKTNYHHEDNNPVDTVFIGRTHIEKAASYFRYTKGSRYNRLIHHLKYKGRQDVGEQLGYMYAKELEQSGFFEDIDLLVPVPLHKKRQKQRGYNQSEMIADGIARKISKPVDNNILVRVTNTETQTLHTRTERWENVANVFKMLPTAEVSGKHLCLIDDVITTGATIEASCNALKTVGDVKVSVLSLCLARSG